MLHVAFEFWSSSLPKKKKKYPESYLSKKRIRVMFKKKKVGTLCQQSWHWCSALSVRKRSLWLCVTLSCPLA
jgi:hypothetical protein